MNILSRVWGPYDISLSFYKDLFEGKLCPEP